MTDQLHVVTGAFGYTGKYITRRLLAEGIGVRTLTGHPDRPSEFGDRLEVKGLPFGRPLALEESLRGAEVLYNTYWIRFERGTQTFDGAVANTKVLFEAAQRAGVRRIVHVSIANATSAPHLPYYAGKAELEAALRHLDVSHAILRPTVIFGDEDILINNIAWLLRRFPAFAIPGDGKYRLRPIFVEDMAKLAVEQAGNEGNVTLDAVGPETLSFNELVSLLRNTVNSRSRVVHVPPMLAQLAARLISLRVGDVVLTPDEVKGLLADLLGTDGPPAGETRLSEWLRDHARDVGAEYASEVARHYT
jgi:NADH dehydrogenase